MTHHDPNKQMYVDLDALGKGFGVMVYHAKRSAQALQTGGESPNLTKTPPSCNVICLILFLSKLCTLVESRYWPMELEVACLVWTICKIQHLIEGAGAPTIIYTNHSAMVDIAKHTHLGLLSTDKLNL
jgi:hypothetical protein